MCNLKDQGETAERTIALRFEKSSGRRADGGDHYVRYGVQTSDNTMSFGPATKMLCYGNDSEGRGDGTAIRGDCECRSTGDTRIPKVPVRSNYGRGKVDQN